MMCAAGTLPCLAHTGHYSPAPVTGPDLYDLMIRCGVTAGKRRGDFVTKSRCLRFHLIVLEFAPTARSPAQPSLDVIWRSLEGLWQPSAMEVARNDVPYVANFQVVRVAVSCAALQLLGQGFPVDSCAH